MEPGHATLLSRVRSPVRPCIQLRSAMGRKRTRSRFAAAGFAWCEVSAGNRPDRATAASRGVTKMSEGVCRAGVESDLPQPGLCFARLVFSARLRYTKSVADAGIHEHSIIQSAHYPA